MSPRVVIQDETHAKRRMWFIAVAAAVVLASAFGLYTLGRMHAPGDFSTYQVSQQRLDAERKRLTQENRRLKAENRALSERIVALNRGNDIDNAASDELRQALTDLQAQVEESKKELGFYRGILSPEGAKAGVRVQQLSLEKMRKPRTYNFDLILIQSARNEKRVQGKINVRIDGLRNDEIISLAWDDVALDSKQDIVFSFKYFQEITQAFRLPDNFEPTLVEIEIDAGKRDDAFVDRYDWNKLIQANG